MAGTKELGKLGLTTGFFNSEQDRLDYFTLITVNPNGVYAGNKGTLALDVTNVNIYQNTDGGTAWKDYNADISINSSVSFVHVNEANTYLSGGISAYVNGLTQFTLLEEDIYTVSLSSLDGVNYIRKTYMLQQNGGTFGLLGTQLTDADFVVMGTTNTSDFDVFLVSDYSSWDLYVSSNDRQRDFNQKVFTKIIGLEASQGQINTASNLGVGENLFSTKVGSDLQFKSLKSADFYLDLTSTATEVSIDTSPLQERYNVPTTIVADYTLTTSNHGSVIFIDNGASNVTITVPQFFIDDALAFSCGFIQLGTGEVDFASTGGTILNYPAILGTIMQGENFSCFIQQRSWNSLQYSLLGDLKS